MNIFAAFLATYTGDIAWYWFLTAGIIWSVCYYKDHVEKRYSG